MSTIVEDKYDKLSLLMNEKLRRRWAACEALALGRGGISAVAAATGLSRTTIRKGIEEVRHQFPDLAANINLQRVREPGAGRHPIEETDPTLLSDLTQLVDPATRGEPTSPLLWTSKSTRNLAEELNRVGHQVSVRTVARLLHDYTAIVKWSSNFCAAPKKRAHDSAS